MRMARTDLSTLPFAASTRTFLDDPVQPRVRSRHLKTSLNLGLLISLTLFGSDRPSLTQEAAAGSQRQLERITPGQDWPRILERVRRNALAYTDQLPNFICRQTTRRFVRSTGIALGWRKTGSFVAALSFYDKKEHYEILSVNGRPVKEKTIETLTGGLSTGEFGSALRGLFEPRTQAVFRREGIKTMNKVKTLCIAFEVPQERSRRFISYNKRTIITAYRGRCWVDPINYRVVRLEKKAVGIPRDFPVTRFDMSIDYAPFAISNARHWLPKEAEIWISRRLPGRPSTQLHTKNRIRFGAYRRFMAGVKLVTD